MNPHLPPITRALLIANIGLYLVQMLAGDFMVAHLALWPLGPSPYSNVPGFEPWQLLSYGFLHGSLMHLAFNMFALWMFGGTIERTLGQKPYLTYYLVSVVGAGLTQLAVMHFFPSGYFPTVGASGGVFGLLLAFGLMYPHQRIMLLFPPIPMPAWLFVTGYGLIELYLGITGTQAGVAHFAHLGGMLFGFLLIHYWRGRMPWKPRRILMR